MIVSEASLSPPACGGSVREADEGGRQRCNPPAAQFMGTTPLNRGGK
jgi:hypothetical protein